MGRGGRIRAGLATGTLLLAVLHASPAGSAPPAGGAIRLQVGDTATSDEERLLRAVEDSLGRKKGFDAKIEELDGKLRTVQGKLRNAQNALGVAMARQRGVEIKLADIQRQLAAAKEGLRAQAIAAYIGRPSGISVVDLLRTATIDQFATKQTYIRLVSATQADLILDREHLQDQNNDLLEELDRARSAAQKERDVIAGQQSALAADRSAQAAVRYQLSVEIANSNEVLQEIVSRRDEFQAQAKELEAQSAAVAESLGRRTSSSSSQSSSQSSSSSSSGGRLDDPLPSISVASSYGYRVHPIYGDVRLHTGVDLNANSGNPIRAAGDGTVVSAGWLGGYGNAVIIDHGAGLATLYAHQSQMLVSAGQHVTKGQVIGKVGCTGSCTGPHLHYEVRINGIPVDPMPYL